MKSVIMIACLATVLFGCAPVTQQNEWRNMSFVVPPKLDEQDVLTEKNMCIKEVEVSEVNDTLWYWPGDLFGRWFGGKTSYNKNRSFLLQDCMALKGFPCKKDCAYEPGEKPPWP